MKEQPAPLTPEEKYNLEGMTPEMREAAKEGFKILQKSIDEFSDDEWQEALTKKH